MYNKRLVFAAACLGMLLFGISLISLGTILPELIASYDMSEMAAGWLVSILPLGILAGSLVFGPVVDRYGYKSLLIINGLLIILGFEGIAFADSLFILQLSVFLIGFAGGVLNGGTSALVSDITTGDRGANLSLLGVFFGIGALGMPVLLSFLSEVYSYNQIISVIGFSIFAFVLYFTLLRFPSPKQAQGLPLRQGFRLIGEPAILIFGFYLFFQSGVEGLVNNWTTTFLQKEVGVSSQNSLVGLSLFVGAMTVTRLLLGGLLKRVSSYGTLFTSLGLASVGSLFLLVSGSFAMSVAGLLLLGIGVAAGFPVILGFVGNIYTSLSGTAFSIVLVIGLIGNMSINYLMGVVAQYLGFRQLPVLLLCCLVIMVALLWRAGKMIPEEVK